MEQKIVQILSDFGL